MAPSAARRSVVTILIAGLSVLIGIQFIRPSLSSGPTSAEIAAPAAAVQVLKTSCYSCHSNERRLAWFDEIVPAYWLVRKDINDARAHLNFSTLGGKPAAAQRAALYEAVNMALFGAMPLKDYILLHPEAKVRQSDLDQLKAYLAPWHDLPKLEADPAQLVLPASATPTASGLQFDPSYSGWHLLSVTDRGDNTTFRLILGNDIATRAAREGHISPWPEDSRFAKIAWQQRSAPDGTIRPGQFIQVEMMVKGKEAYRATEGWGWGRWKGPSLKPYGDTAQVVEECTGCHAPMKRNDFVYTMPISNAHDQSDKLNDLASWSGLPFDPLTATPVTLYVDRQHSTISVLFERDAAGKELLLVTWKERDDPHWFGAKIPGEPVAAEYLRDSGHDGPIYTRIPTHNVDAAADVSSQMRMQFIQQLKSAQSMNR